MAQEKKTSYVESISSLEFPIVVCQPDEGQWSYVSRTGGAHRPPVLPIHSIPSTASILTESKTPAPKRLELESKLDTSQVVFLLGIIMLCAILVYFSGKPRSQIVYILPRYTSHHRYPFSARAIPEYHPLSTRADLDSQFSRFKRASPLSCYT
jgi:hypothetical protein